MKTPPKSRKRFFYPFEHCSANIPRTTMKTPFQRVLFLLLLAPFMLTGQQLDLSKLKGMKIRNIGPAGMSGRVTSIDVVHSDPDQIYIATASGGIWKSNSGGISWKPIFDDQPVQSLGAIAIDQSNPSIIWAGTGEGNPRNSHNSGGGIYKSLDAGRNWVNTGLNDTKTIHRIIVDPTNSDIVYAAAMGSIWGPNEERGVYKTTDGGDSWQKILYANDTTGCADLIIDPSNPKKLIAAMWEYHREPWFFTSGGRGSGLYISFDGGETWKQRTKEHGLPNGKLGRIGLGICRTQPQIMYALVEAETTGLYRSNDGGFSWNRQATENIGNRPFYYADIYIDPVNENRIYNLHSFVTRSEDGGKTFSPLTSWGSKVHPDHHAFYIHPTDPNFLIDGNDGGLAISRDRGASWQFVENLPLAQFYHINYDMDVPYNIYGGMQDNGSWAGPSEVWGSGGIRNHHWQELMFGDGFDVVPVPGNSRMVYAMSQGGNVALVDRLTGSTSSVQPVHPEDKPLRFNWNAAIAQGPNDSCTVYFGSQYLHRSTDCGESWSIISPDLTTNDTSKQKQAQSGGLTIDATRAENYTTIVSIAPSPLQKGLIWVGTDDGNLQMSTNGGGSWSNLIKKLPGAPSGAWIPQIIASEHTAGEAFVVLNDYRRNNWDTYLYHTRDFGKSWRRLTNTDEVEGFALSVVQDPQQENLLFLGTDRGLYFSIDYGTHWTKWDKGFPSVSTKDLKIHPREGDLIVGTFGRAAWILDDLAPLRELAKSGQDLLERPFFFFEVNDAWNGEYRSASEGRFLGQANYVGRNSYRGAKMYVYVKEPEEKQKIHMTIFNQTGDTIRYRTVKPDTGLKKINWSFDRNGVNSPSYRDVKPDADPPSGPRVLPGSYTVRMVYKDDSTERNFQVLPDPRTSVSVADLNAREEGIQKWYSITKATASAFNQLKEAKKTLDKVDGMLSMTADSIKDTLSTQARVLRDSIDALMATYTNPPSFKGYDHVTPRLNNQMWNAYSAVASEYRRPGPNDLQALANYKKNALRVLTRVNSFFEKEWIAYRKQIEVVEKPIFEELKPVQIDD